jgi:hypothetical protein
MANPDIPRGFEPVGSTSGSDYCGKTQAYAIAAADTVAVGIGDLVKRTGEMVTIDGQTYPVVAQATAGATLLEGGVIGFSPDADSFTTFRSAGAKSAPRICYLSADPYIEYEAQADGNIPDASAGLNANIIVGVPDSAATATLQVRLVRRSRVVNNESGANALWVVRINNQATRSTTGL